MIKCTVHSTGQSIAPYMDIEIQVLSINNAGTWFYVHINNNNNTRGGKGSGMNQF